MAPRTRAHRQHASTTRPSVNITANGAPLLLNSKSPDNDCEPGRFVYKPSEVEDTQEEELEMDPRQPYAYVLGREMLVPHTHDPDMYDPDGPVTWTPRPEPYDAEIYTAWGRKHS